MNINDYLTCYGVLYSRELKNIFLLIDPEGLLQPIVISDKYVIKKRTDVLHAVGKIYKKETYYLENFLNRLQSFAVIYDP